MRRGFFSLVSAVSLCASPALIAQRGIELHGTPASVTSPALDGRLRGVPASVTDPNIGSRRLSSERRHRDHDRDVRPVFVSPGYGYYVGFNDYAGYDDSQQPPLQPAQAQAGNEDAQTQPDDSSRYGQHYFDGRDSNQQSDRNEDRLEPSKPAVAPTPAAADSPPTTLVYRDGHKSEVRNYAIVGSNLIDLSKSPVLKKIPLDSLDLVATRKENEDNGVDFHTP